MELAAVATPCAGAGGSGASTDRGSVTQERVQELFVHHFKEIITPCFELMTREYTGIVDEETRCLKPGIFYNNDYAVAFRKVEGTITYAGIPGGDPKKIETMLRRNGYFYSAMGPKEFWERIRGDFIGGWSYDSLIMKEGDFSPSKAVKALQQTTTFLDCAGVQILAEHLVLIDVWGEEGFDEIIRAQAPKRLQIGSCPNPEAFDISTLVMDKIPRKYPSSITGRLPKDLIIGQTYYLANIPEYTKKHPDGCSMGMNLIYLGEGKFTGFGLNSEGMTLLEVAQSLRDDYNKPPIDPRLLLTDAVIAERPPFQYTLAVGSGRDRREISTSLEHCRHLVELGKDGFGFSMEEIRSQLIPFLERQKAELARHTLTMDEFMLKNPFFQEGSHFLLMSAEKVNRLFRDRVGRK